MTIEYKLPELGEDIETGEVINVYVSPGDTVSEEQPLMEIETDKAAIEVPSPASGVIKSLHVSDGETIKVGQLLVTIEDGEGGDTESEATEEAPEQSAEAESAEESAEEEKDEEITPESEDEAEEAKEESAEPESADEPEAEEIEQELEDEPEDEAEETKEESAEPEPKDKQEDDSEDETEAEETEDEPEEAKEPSAEPEPEDEPEVKEESEIEEEKSQEVKDAPSQPVPASPSVRRLARELGIDITTVKGTGPGGRISEADLRASAGSEKKAKAPEDKAPAPKKESTKKTKTKTKSKPGGEEREKMSKVRRLTAERLTEAWKAPHVTQYDKADITELEALRKQFGESVGKSGGKLTMTSILIKVVAKTLKEFPEMNASVDMESSEIVYKHFYNIGIAVDTERGLLVPVVKDADKKNITELSVELADISERARNKKVTADELRGGTFTITNLGGIGGTYFSPVLNAPEVGILGVSRSFMEPVYVEEEFVPRLMLPLSLSYDHRLVDGANAIRFLRRVIERLEEPHSWFLKIN